MERYTYLLREIAERIGLGSVKQIAAQPGIRTVYRITLYYPDRRASDTVATLIQLSLTDVVLQVVYLGYFDNNPLIRQLTTHDYEALASVFSKLSFDRLLDQSDMPSYGADLCLVERAAGGFVKGVLFAPQHASGVYINLLETLRSYLPEALREV